MNIENFTPWTALTGGLLIGLSAALLMLLNGRIAGISGITKGLFSETSTQERSWRLAFLAGLILGGMLIVWLLPQHTALAVSFQPVQMLVSGFFVGVGTAMANGCTSGHGVCGLGRRSGRSLASVLTFMGAGFVTMFLMTQVFGWGRV